VIAVGVGPSGQAALRLLACCPWVPADVVGSLLQLQHTRSASQVLGRLRAAGLVHYRTLRPGPIIGNRQVRVWALTAAGRLFQRGGLPASGDTAGLLVYGTGARSRISLFPPATPILVAAYRLLANVARGMDRPVVSVWECPWVRAVSDTRTGRSWYLRLPAAVVLTDHNGREQTQELLLLPDYGTLPVASYRQTLRRLVDVRSGRDMDGGCAEPRLVVGVAVERGQAARIAVWHSILERLARQSGERPINASVVAWSGGTTAQGQRKQALGGQADQVLGLVARHPLLEQRQLAAVLDTSTARVSQLVRRLSAVGWIRSLHPLSNPPDSLQRPPRRSRRLLLVELSPAGRREAARRLLLPSNVAGRHHGVLGRISDKKYTWHLAHTLGANAVFVALVVAARHRRELGFDDALEEWRGAAACARGRFRPDGYGCYRRRVARFGFFLEFDRGTEKSREYAAKLETYYRYRDTGTARRDYIGFPVALVVTTSELAEDRFAHQAYLAQQRHGGTPISLFLTTTSRIQAHRDGVLGTVWRGPGRRPISDFARVSWIPGHPHKPGAECARPW
jgi:DNA-binding MarR family transcriptional regulator